MANVGRLNVQITAGNRGLARGLASSSSMIRGFAGTGSKLLGGLTGGFGRLAGLAGIGGIGAAMGGAVLGLRHGADAVDALSTSSKKLFGNKGATGALAGIRTAAEEAGVEADVAEKGIAKMLETISKANQGDKGAVEALSAVGLSARELMQVRPEDRLLSVADALGRVGDAGDKINFARGIFGKGGADMIPLFNEGSKAIRNATAEMELFGHSISTVDAAKVDAAGDMMGKLKKIAEGVTMQFAVQFAPLIEEIGIRLIGLIENSNGVGAAVQNAFGQGVEFAAGFLDKLEDLEVGWLKLKGTALNVAASIAESILKITDDGGKTAAYVAEKELQKRAQYMAPDKREEFIKRAREAGGFQDERVHLGRVAEGLRAGSDGAQSEIDAVNKRRQEKGTLGARFKDFVYTAQTGALERAQNNLLDNETAITGELEDQKKLRDDSAKAEAGQGRAGLMAFSGPVFNAAAATAHTARAEKSAGAGSGETNNILRDIHGTLRGGVAAVYA